MKNLPQFPIETMRNKIERIVEQACAADTNIFGYGIWTHHILKVVQNAKRVGSGIIPFLKSKRKNPDFDMNQEELRAYLDCLTSSLGSRNQELLQARFWYQR